MSTLHENLLRMTRQELEVAVIRFGGDPEQCERKVDLIAAVEQGLRDRPLTPLFTIGPEGALMLRKLIREGVAPLDTLVRDTPVLDDSLRLLRSYGLAWHTRSRWELTSQVKLLIIGLTKEQLKLLRYHDTLYTTIHGALNLYGMMELEELVELMRQTEAICHGREYPPQVFAYPIAYNLIPQIGGPQEHGYTSEEMKLHYEGRKILHRPDFKASSTCVRVPVLRSHSVSARVTFERPVSVEQARQAIAVAPGCRLVDDLAQMRYPMPRDTSCQDLVYVGRIRPDLADPCSLHLWCSGDQLRKGAATNAVQIAELLTG